MFGLLKKKLSKVVESISDRLKKKEEAAEKVEEMKQELEEKIEPVIEKMPIERVIEEIAPILEEKTPELKEEIKVAVEEVKEEIKQEIDKVEEKPKEKKSLFKKITEKIVKKVTEKRISENDLEPILVDLKSGLLEADASYEVVQKIQDDLKSGLVDKEVKRGAEKVVVIGSLRKSLLGILSVPKIDINEIIEKAKAENRPSIVLFYGVNGVGKSLNLSKLAFWLKNKGYRPILGAGDTFRAAGDIQLEEYARRIDVPVVKHQRGADAAAVIFDARKSAEARGYDVVLGDTSGRMHVKKDLLDELAKIIRVNKPDLKILVLDSLTGSDAVSQFEFFDKAVGVDAVIFSKNDVNEKGGNILSICYMFKKPILFLGTGQNYQDLIEYDPQKFVDSLLGLNTLKA